MIENKRASLGRNITINTVFILISLMCLIPFLLVVSISFSLETDIYQYGYSIIPKTFSTMSYEFIFSNPWEITNGYMVSTFVTVVGTVISVLMMATTGYCLARKNFSMRRPMMFFIFFTMLFNGGLVPSYILIANYLHLKNTIWVLILPTLVNVFHIVLLRTFFSKLPDALFESAKLDGASELRIFFSIAVPLSTPSLATVALLGAMGRWNDWQQALLYIDVDNLRPLQYLLQRIMADLQFFTSMPNMPENIKELIGSIPNETARMAMCVLATGPMMFIFPFFQKYFVKGLTVGSVKE